MRVVLADDHELILDGLENLFRSESDIDVVARCTDGEAALRETRRMHPDILILDIRMPRVDGLEVLKTIRQEGLSTQVVVLTAGLEDDEVLEAVRLGARGVVLKEMAPRLIVQCLRKVLQGGAWLEQQSAGRVLQRMVRRETAESGLAGVLTRRELEVVRMVARGLRNKEIADRLRITEGTVKVHLHNTYEKLHLGGRLELTLYAQEKGLV